MAAPATVGVLWAIGVALGFASCGAGPGRQPVGPVSAAPRRAWIGWRPGSSGPPAVRACGSNAADPVPGVGQAGCWRGSVGGPVLMTDDGFARDTSPVDSVPSGRCAITYENPTAARGPSTARAWLGSPSERGLVDEWRPRPQTGDQSYAIELSFSPDGQWMAIVHLRTRDTPSGAIVEVDGVDVVPARACP